ncbi:MAG: hypothetical protein EOM26_02670 [Alphaproteobacteria bacterium]|nr:hypothetical protein [Alphaproteobacteria bacterium]
MSRQGFLFLLMLVFGLAATGISPVRAAGDEVPRFLTVLQDVPLMPGLEELIDESVVFDKPSGRIAESMAVSGSLPEGAISRFYSLTLPQLGWAPTERGSYVRKDEELKIVVAPRDGGRVVRFTLTPR